MTISARARQMIAALAFLALFAACFARLALLAPSRPLNADEETGIAETIDYSYSRLLLAGPEHELNPSPLHYLLDKSWISAAGNEPHRHYHPGLFFRLLPSLWICLAGSLFGWLFFRLAQNTFHGALSRGFPSLFGLSCALFFSSNFSISHSAALQDRPYALWVLLSVLQTYLLQRSFQRKMRRPTETNELHKPEIFLSLVHILLVLNSFASIVQVAAATLLLHGESFLRRRPHWRAHFVEVAPALLIALWFWSRSQPAETSTVGTADFVRFWLNAITLYVWNPSWSLNAVIHLGAGWREPGLLILLLSLGLLAAPLAVLEKNSPARALYFFVTIVHLLAIPVLLTAWLSARSVDARYFSFLFPMLAVLQPLFIIGLAGRLGSLRPAAFGVFVSAWILLQLLSRAPLLFADIRESSQGLGKYYSDSPSALCPENLGQFRIGKKNAIDTLRLTRTCIDGVKAGPTDEPAH